jgi:hypothetical protein
VVGIAGFRADLAVIDDPVRSREDADSQAVRDRTWDWYKTDLLPACGRVAAWCSSRRGGTRTTLLGASSLKLQPAASNGMYSRCQPRPSRAIRSAVNPANGCGTTNTVIGIGSLARHAEQLVRVIELDAELEMLLDDVFDRDRRPVTAPYLLSSRLIFVPVSNPQNCCVICVASSEISG